MIRSILYSFTLFIITALASPAAHAQIQAYDCACVDVSPSFPGGDRAMLKFINSVKQYPEDARDCGAQGRVTCSFIVKADGSICNPKVIRCVHESLDREAIRIIREMPRWQAGKINGNCVPVYYVLSIPFRL